MGNELSNVSFGQIKSDYMSTKKGFIEFVCGR
jgi:hypothetical protein